MNSPCGPTSDVVVRSCTFRHVDPPAHWGIHLGGASVSGFRIVGNQFEGAGKSAIHVEEDARDWTIIGNVVRAEGDAVQICGNQVAGRARAPRRILIEGNTFHSATPGARSGVKVYQGEGQARPAEILIQGNAISDYCRGILLKGPENVLVRGNELSGNQTAIEVSGDHAATQPDLVSSPKGIRIQGNTMSSAAAGAGKGVWVLPGVGGTLPEEVQLGANSIADFQYGIHVEETDSIVVADNWFRGCTVGLFKSWPSTDVRDNRFEECDAPLHCQDGGMWGPQSMTPSRKPGGRVTAVFDGLHVFADRFPE